MDGVPDEKERVLAEIAIYNLDDSIDPGTRILIFLPCVDMGYRFASEVLKAW